MLYRYIFFFSHRQPKTEPDASSLTDKCDAEPITGINDEEKSLSSNNSGLGLISNVTSLAAQNDNTTKSQYPCPLCDYKHVSRHVIRQHLCAVHFKDEILASFGVERLGPCPICQKTFTGYSGLARHLGTVHNGDRFVSALEDKNLDSLYEFMPDPETMEQHDETLMQMDAEAQEEFSNRVGSWNETNDPRHCVETEVAESRSCSKKWGDQLRQFFPGCAKCNNGFESAAVLVAHLTRVHFGEELMGRYVSDSRICLICKNKRSVFSMDSNTERYKAMFHVGTFHGKILEVVPAGLRELLIEINPVLRRKADKMMLPSASERDEEVVRDDDSVVSLPMDEEPVILNHTPAQQTQATDTIMRNLTPILPRPQGQIQNVVHLIQPQMQQGIPSTTQQQILILNPGPALNTTATTPLKLPIPRTGANIVSQPKPKPKPKPKKPKRWAGALEPYVGQCNRCTKGFIRASDMVDHLCLVHFRDQLQFGCDASGNCLFCGKEMYMYSKAESLTSPIFQKYAAQHVGNLHAKILDVVPEELRQFLLRESEMLRTKELETVGEGGTDNFIPTVSGGTRDDEQVFVMDEVGSAEMIVPDLEESDVVDTSGAGGGDGGRGQNVVILQPEVVIGQAAVTTEPEVIEID